MQLFAKREDCNSGLAFGGNKTRKLEYLIPEAIKQGCDTLVSIGGIQSNQTRQVAAVAAHLGLKCVLVQENWVNYSDAVYDRVGNIQMSRIMGADVRLVSDGFDIGFRESWQQASRKCVNLAASPTPFLQAARIIPWGDWVIVGFAEEVRQQEASWDSSSTMSSFARLPAALRQAWSLVLPLTAGLSASLASMPRRNRGRPKSRFSASRKTLPSRSSLTGKSPMKTSCSKLAMAARSTAYRRKGRGRDQAVRQARRGDD